MSGTTCCEELLSSLAVKRQASESRSPWNHLNFEPKDDPNTQRAPWHQPDWNQEDSAYVQNFFCTSKCLFAFDMCCVNIFEFLKGISVRSKTLNCSSMRFLSVGGRMRSSWCCALAVGQVAPGAWPSSYHTVLRFGPSYFRVDLPL